MKKLLLSIAAAGVAIASTASAAIDIFIDEVGSDVVATFSGDIDLTGAVSLGSGGFFAGVNAAFPAVNFSDAMTSLDAYALTSFETFGPGNSSFNLADSWTGDLFVINNQTGTGDIYFAPGYMGGFISGSMTFLNSSLSVLGLETGTYTYTLPNDQVNLYIGDGVNAVPVPAAALLMGPALAGFVARRRRKA